VPRAAQRLQAKLRSAAREAGRPACQTGFPHAANSSRSQAKRVTNGSRDEEAAAKPRPDRPGHRADVVQLPVCRAGSHFGARGRGAAAGAPADDVDAVQQHSRTYVKLVWDDKEGPHRRGNAPTEPETSLATQASAGRIGDGRRPSATSDSFSGLLGAGESRDVLACAKAATIELRPCFIGPSASTAMCVGPIMGVLWVRRFAKGDVWPTAQPSGCTSRDARACPCESILTPWILSRPASVRVGRR
jgi:hypothetical protein